MCPGLAEQWLHKGLEAEGLGWLARLSIVIHADMFLVLIGEFLVVANFLEWWLVLTTVDNCEHIPGNWFAFITKAGNHHITGL